MVNDFLIVKWNDQKPNKTPLSKLSCLLGQEFFLQHFSFKINSLHHHHSFIIRSLQYCSLFSGLLASPCSVLYGKSVDCHFFSTHGAATGIQVITPITNQCTAVCSCPNVALFSTALTPDQKKTTMEKIEVRISGKSHKWPQFGSAGYIIIG